MEENIKFDGFGCEIIQRGKKLFVRFDEGHFVVKFSEYEISENEAKKIMISENDAYQTLLKIQNRKE